jgi:hypothetical protein
LVRPSQQNLALNKRPRPQRIEPARLEDVPEAISNVVAELAAASAKRGHALSKVELSERSGLLLSGDYKF